jgi:hypothetical protein
MNETPDRFTGFQQVFGEANVTDVTKEELRDIDELRRFAADVAEPETPTYTVGVNGAAPEYTVHFKNIVR